MHNNQTKVCFVNVVQNKFSFVNKFVLFYVARSAVGHFAHPNTPFALTETKVCPTSFK